MSLKTFSCLVYIYFAVSVVCVIAQEDEYIQKGNLWQALHPSQEQLNFHSVLRTLNSIVGDSVLESRGNEVFFSRETVKKQFNDWLGNLTATIFEENPKRQAILDRIKSKVEADLARVCNTPLLQFGGGEKVDTFKNSILRRNKRSLIGNLFSFGKSAALRPLTSLINKTLKEVFIIWFEESYGVIGKIATMPFRWMLENIINSLLPCTKCPSLL
ncbi:unnamed protein product [Callosobruchus maculatus]|uniref:Uncharacterized protein n=1 Tax=Callosobruchus maculatus TaxID=64391 RepID=A0A653BK34_CALMS|nr:unnamed protein product [Callosobruchus maculatus]